MVGKGRKWIQLKKLFINSIIASPTCKHWFHSFWKVENEKIILFLRKSLSNSQEQMISQSQCRSVIFRLKWIFIVSFCTGCAWFSIIWSSNAICFEFAMLYLYLQEWNAISGDKRCRKHAILLASNRKPQKMHRIFTRHPSILKKQTISKFRDERLQFFNIQRKTTIETIVMNKECAWMLFKAQNRKSMKNGIKIDKAKYPRW